MTVLWTFTVGSLCFVAGSLLFFPHYEHDYQAFAAILYIVGCICYLVGSVQNLNGSLQVLRHAPTRSCCSIGNDESQTSEAAAASARRSSTLDRLLLASVDLLFVIGSFVYLIGSVLFVPYLQGDGDQNRVVRTGAMCFIIGSAAVLLSSVVASVHGHDLPSQSQQQAQQPRMRWSGLIQMGNSIGAVLFAMASVPYLRRVQYDSGANYNVDEIFWLSALQYTVGSVAFTIAGLAYQIDECGSVGAHPDSTGGTESDEGRRTERGHSEMVNLEGPLGVSEHLSSGECSNGDGTTRTDDMKHADDSSDDLSRRWKAV